MAIKSAAVVSLRVCITHLKIINATLIIRIRLVARKVLQGKNYFCRITKVTGIQTKVKKSKMFHVKQFKIEFMER